jgi:hypothetical protein
MEIVGWIATIAVAAIVLTGVVVGLSSIPDVKRYLRLRRM